MPSIDIRDEDDEIDKIVFANDAETSEEHSALAFFLATGHEVFHDKFIFIEGGNDYVAIRRSDVGNLIKALQKAQEIWK